MLPILLKIIARVLVRYYDSALFEDQIIEEVQRTTMKARMSYPPSMSSQEGRRLQYHLNVFRQELAAEREDPAGRSRSRKYRNLFDD